MKPKTAYIGHTGVQCSQPSSVAFQPTQASQATTSNQGNALPHMMFQGQKVYLSNANKVSS